MFTKPVLLGLTLCSVIALAGCGKKESTADTPPPETPAAAAVNTPPAPPNARPPGAPEAATMDAVIFSRSLDYAKGQVIRKNYPAAREAVKRLDVQSLTPAQRKALDEVKASIPNS